MKKTYLLIIILVCFCAGGWSLFVQQDGKAFQFVTGSDQTIDDTSEMTDLVQISTDVEELNQKSNQERKGYLTRELALSERDKRAADMIARIQKEHGISEKEFQEKYKSVFKKME